VKFYNNFNIYLNNFNIYLLGPQVSSCRKRSADGKLVSHKLAGVGTQNSNSQRVFKKNSAFGEILAENLANFVGTIPNRFCPVCAENSFSNSIDLSTTTQSEEFFLLPRESFQGIVDSGYNPDLFAFEGLYSTPHVNYEGIFFDSVSEIRNHHEFPTFETCSLSYLSRNQHIFRPELDFLLICALTDRDPAVLQLAYPWLVSMKFISIELLS
jgi:hypothetical protein